MSDFFLRLIPPSPETVPPEAARRGALTAARRLLPGADEVRELIHEQIEFVDAGCHFEKLYCPSCRSEVAQAWWLEQMDRAHEGRFQDLGVRPPCCGAETSLNELQYDWPQGFARYVLEIRNPGIGGREELLGLLVELKAVFGFQPRVIWARI
jgi:hypothetical protein